MKFTGAKSLTVSGAFLRAGEGRWLTEQDECLGLKRGLIPLILILISFGGGGSGGGGTMKIIWKVLMTNMHFAERNLQCPLQHREQSLPAGRNHTGAMADSRADSSGASGAISKVKVANAKNY